MDFMATVMQILDDSCLPKTNSLYPSIASQIPKTFQTAGQQG
jgi:hypothetical protein